MNNNSFDQKILNKIKSRNIKPKARWHFLFKNYFIWASGIVALLFSALSVSIMLYLARYNDFGIRREVNKSLFEILILTLPYFWVIFLGLFVFIVYYNLKHTKKGYRYPIWSIIVGAIISSVLLGGIFSSIGWGEKLDEILGRKAPLYENVMNPHLDFWSNPKEGRLVGMVISPLEDGKFSLVDKNRRKWNVKFEKKESEIIIVEGRPVRLLGREKSNNNFEADKVFPMMPGRGFFKQFSPNLHPPMPIVELGLPHLPERVDCPNRDECERMKKNF